MVITQESTQSLAALNRPIAADVRTPREQQDVALPLVIPLGMKMFDIFPQRAPQGALAKQDHLGQALLLHRPDPALRIGIQVRAARGQHERLASLSGFEQPGGSRSSYVDEQEADCNHAAIVFKIRLLTVS